MPSGSREACGDSSRIAAQTLCDPCSSSRPFRPARFAPRNPGQASRKRLDRRHASRRLERGDRILRHCGPATWPRPGQRVRAGHRRRAPTHLGHVPADRKAGGGLTGAGVPAEREKRRLRQRRRQAPGPSPRRPQDNRAPEPLARRARTNNRIVAPTSRILPLASLPGDPLFLLRLTSAFQPRLTSERPKPGGPSLRSRRIFAAPCLPLGKASLRCSPAREERLPVCREPAILRVAGG